MNLFIKPIAADIVITDWIQQMDMWLPRQHNPHYTIGEFLQDVHVASESARDNDKECDVYNKIGG